jgi:hypothetical protein
MTHEELEEAVPLYAAGALERPERQALEAHLLSGCATCHAALKDYQGVAALLPFALTPVPPPDRLKAALLAARNPVAPPIEDVKQHQKPSLEPGEWMNHLFPPIVPSRSWPFQLAFWSLLALLVAGAGYLAWDTYSRSMREADRLTELEVKLQQETAQVAGLQRDVTAREGLARQLREELDVRRTDLTELRDQLIQREAELNELRTQLAQRETSSQRMGNRQDDIVSLLKHPHARVVMLAGTERAKQAGGLVLFDPGGKRALFYAFDLPDLPAGTVYQLWAIDDRPASLGLFTLDAGRKGRLLIKEIRNLSRLRQVAITVEPAGGRPQPTGAMYLTGELS